MREIARRGAGLPEAHRLRRGLRGARSEPLDVELPGARSVKVVLDQAGRRRAVLPEQRHVPDPLRLRLDAPVGRRLPLVPPLAEFNATEYFTPGSPLRARRGHLLRGARRRGCSSSRPTTPRRAEMIASSVRGGASGRASSAPRSPSTRRRRRSRPRRRSCPTTIPVDHAPTSSTPASTTSRSTSARRWAGCASSKAAELDTRVPVVPGHRRARPGAQRHLGRPGDHHRGVPDAALARQRAVAEPRHAQHGAARRDENPTLRALEGKWVELTVGAFDWSVARGHRGGGRGVLGGAQARRRRAAADSISTVTELRDIEDVTPEPATGESLRDAIKTRVLAFGGKAAHYSILAQDRRASRSARRSRSRSTTTTSSCSRTASTTQIDALLADPEFKTDAGGPRRAAAGAARRHDGARRSTPTFQDAAQGQAGGRLPGRRRCASAPAPTARISTASRAPAATTRTRAIRRTGTTCCDADPQDLGRASGCSAPSRSARYHGIDHKSVGMALLVHHNFPDEEANGVAVTANPFDPAGLEPGFYVNVQYGRRRRGGGTRRRA